MQSYNWHTEAHVRARRAHGQRAAESRCIIAESRRWDDSDGEPVSPPLFDKPLPVDLVLRRVE